MGHLSKSLIYVLSLYVLGMVIVRHCGQSQITALLSGLMDCEFNTMRQRLREWTYEAKQKRGSQRQEVDVSSCFAPLLTWVLSKFTGQHKQVVLALDVTYLGDRFIILAVSVMVAGCAIPVAWHIRRGCDKGEWNPIWIRLLTQVAPALTPDWQVFILTDSGLYSKTLYQILSKQFKWHVLMRIGFQGLFKAKGQSKWRSVQSLAHRGMATQVIAGTCFKTHPIACTLVLQWQAEYDKPCLLVTDLPAQDVNHNIYSIRYWIESDFKDIKRGLLHWEQTKMTCPQRAERLWLVISIAMLWLTAVGDAASHLPQWHSLHHARPRTRILSTPVLGWIDILLTLLKGQPLPYGHFNPYPWLTIPET